jgi:Tol biopolymer transport system component
LAGYPDGVIGRIAYSPNGKILATVVDGPTRLWDARTGAVLRVVPGDQLGRALGVAFAPDGRSLVTGSADRSAMLWDVATGAVRRTLTGHQGAITVAAYSPDGRTVATAGLDGTVRLWDPVTGQVRHLLTGLGAAIMVMAFSPDGRTVTAADENDGAVRNWDVATGAPVPGLPGIGPVFGLAYSPDGRTLVTTLANDTVHLWDMSTRTQIRSFIGHSDSTVEGVVFAPNGTTFATTSGIAGPVKIWPR